MSNGSLAPRAPWDASVTDDASHELLSALDVLPDRQRAVQLVGARGTMLTGEAYPDRCDGSFFATMRLSPNQRELVVEAQEKGGEATKCDKRRPF